MALSKIDVANMLTGATPVANGGTALTSGFVNGKDPRPDVNPLILNVNMAVAQRGTSSTGLTSSSYNTVDRFKTNISSLGTWTETQETLSSGNAYINGFANALKIDCTTADGSPASSDRIYWSYRFEGQDLQLLKKGTANAEKITIAFWIKATKTGTNILELYDNDNGRAVSTAYTVSSSNTWEHKVVNFPADTTGALGDDNGGSLYLFWYLGAGTNYTSGTLQTTWTGSVTNANRIVGQVNHGDNTSNNVHLTGVQMEVGEFSSTTLPPFQHESFGDNLSRCHRYYQKTYKYGVYAGTATETGIITQFMGADASGSASSYSAHTSEWKVPMRSDPSVTVFDRQGNSGKLTYVSQNFTRSDNKNYTAWYQTNNLFAFYNHSDQSKSGCQWHYIAESEL